MKRIFTVLLLMTISYTGFAQWQLSLTLRQSEGFADISAPTDDVIWTITSNFIIYKTNDGGAHWTRTKPNGLANNISVLQLYGVSASNAFLSVNTNFTGVGPGIIYKTTDSGRNWTPVFSHEGNCEIRVGMFDNKKGLMGCFFSSFNGSIKSGDSLYYTLDGGNAWNNDTANTPVFIDNLVIKGKQVGIANYKYFNYSSKYGIKWAKLKFPSNSNNTLAQFEDSSYVLTLISNGTQVVVKRPGSNEWVQSDGLGPFNFISCLVLDGNECWLGAALDTKDNFYSSDSAKNFTAFTADPMSGFQFLTKARNGRTLVGGTPSFMQGKLWLNKRSTQIVQPQLKQHQKNVIEAAQ